MSTSPIVPAEIFGRILHLCDQETLKDARLVCKQWEDFATAVLFRSLQLVPHILLLNHSLKFLQSYPRLAKCVKRVQIDVDSVKVIRASLSRWLRGTRRNGKRRTMLANDFKFTLDDQDLDADLRSGAIARREQNLVSEIFQLLNNVTSITISGFTEAETAFDCSSLPKSYTKLLAKLDIEIRNTLKDYEDCYGVSPLLVDSLLSSIASAYHGLKNLRIHCLNTKFLPRSPERWDDGAWVPFRRVMKRLQSLEIEVQYPPLKSGGSIDDECEWTHVWFLCSKASEVQSLTVRAWPARYKVSRKIDADYSVSALAFFSLTQSLHAAPSPPSSSVFAELRNLALRDITTKAGDLEALLVTHCPVLNHLHLSDIALLKVGMVAACWICLLKRLRSRLNLEKFSIEGQVYNFSRQNWYVSARKSIPSSIKSRMQKWMVDRSLSDEDCPLPPELEEEWLQSQACKDPEDSDIVAKADLIEHFDQSWNDRRSSVLLSDMEDAEVLSGIRHREPMSMSESSGE